ncbi:hypothetical protein [Selenomonas sp. AE3005]|uniref:hypothetical protein n=1 Tax=Selenomonas sp. AE3005 TaxID=1485543 RepID=UPI0025FF279B|nr:hypothetical protein [Selenomonas sp. AE3005]
MDKKTLIAKVEACEAFELERVEGVIAGARTKKASEVKLELKMLAAYNTGFRDGFQDGYSSAVDALKGTLRNCDGEEAEKSETPLRCLPLPAVRDGDRETSTYTTADWGLKVVEELEEVRKAKGLSQMAEEIADVITVGISWLNALGYNEQARAKIFRAVNDKNRARGYLGDKS